LLSLNKNAVEYYNVIFNSVECQIPIRSYTFSVDGKPAKPADIAPPNSTITSSCYEIVPMVSDVLLAAEFDPRSLPKGSRVDLLVNNQSAEYTSPVKNGDKIEVKIIAK